MSTESQELGYNALFSSTLEPSTPWHFPSNYHFQHDFKNCLSSDGDPTFTLNFHSEVQADPGPRTLAKINFQSLPRHIPPETKTDVNYLNEKSKSGSV